MGAEELPANITPPHPFPSTLPSTETNPPPESPSLAHFHIRHDAPVRLRRDSIELPSTDARGDRSETLPRLAGLWCLRCHFDPP